MFGDHVGCWRGRHNAGGCCREGDWWPRGVVTNGDFCCPSVVHDFDAPQSVLWITPFSEDGLYIEGDFAAVLVEGHHRGRQLRGGCC